MDVFGLILYTLRWALHMQSPLTFGWDMTQNHLVPCRPPIPQICPKDIFYDNGMEGTLWTHSSFNSAHLNSKCFNGYTYSVQIVGTHLNQSSCTWGKSTLIFGIVGTNWNHSSHTWRQFISRFGLSAYDSSVQTVGTNWYHSSYTLKNSTLKFGSSAMIVGSVN